MRAANAVQLMGGKLLARDTSLHAVWVPLAQPTHTLSLRAGATVPTGRLGPNLSFTPFSTRSVDPHVQASFVAGGTWLGMVDLEARVPVYAGPDSVRQGAWLRSDLRGARRLGRATVFAGGSLVEVTDTDTGISGFTELAAVAGGAWTPAEDVGLSLQARLPMWGAPSAAPYDYAVGIGLTWVTGGSSPAGSEGSH